MGGRTQVGCSIVAAASPVRAVRAPTADELARAAAVVATHLRPTPVVDLELPDGRGTVLAKLDTMQPTGAFKVRGALAAVAAYAGPGVRVVTSSAGNHALAVVFAAAQFGVGATVVLPETASPAKIESLRRRGADLVEHGSSSDEAERHALDLAEDDGVVFVSPYNDAHVIAGQGTWVTDIVTGLDGDLTLVVPVGGGGLLSGTALRAASRPGTRVVGAEAAASPAVSAAAAAGRVVPVQVDPTLADGLAGNIEPGAVTPGLAARLVHSFARVTEAEIEAAIRFLALDHGLVVEGAGAVGVAALMSGRVDLAGRAVVLLTGRTLTAAALARVLNP
jgi:threonine dehydratase